MSSAVCDTIFIVNFTRFVDRDIGMRFLGGVLVIQAPMKQQIDSVQIATLMI